MSDKQTLIQRIYATIRKRDILRQQLLDNDGNFSRETRAWMPEFARFCYLQKPTAKVSKITGQVDPCAMAIAEGRREALMWIIERLHFSDENALKMIEQLNQQEES